MIHKHQADTQTEKKHKKQALNDWLNTHHTHNAIFVAVQFSNLYSLIQIKDTNCRLMSNLTTCNHINLNPEQSHNSNELNNNQIST